MELLDQLFHHLPDHRIGVCRLHRQGVLLSQLASHLQTSHHELTAASRTTLVLAAAAHPTWATSANDVLYPIVVSTPRPHLPVYTDGRKCRLETAGHGQCAYVVRTRRAIQEHCRQQHKWANPRQRGRPSQAGQRKLSQPWVDGVWCQKFQPGGTLGRLFQVSRPGDEPALYTAGSDGEVQRALEASFVQGTAAAEKAQQDAHARIQGDDDRHVWHQWLQRTGWARHLAGFDRVWLLEQAQPPQAGERKLAQVCWAVEALIWKAQQASSAEVVGLPALGLIERREGGAPSNEKPFYAQQTGTTMKKYSHYWTSIVCYVWRTHKLPPAERGEEGPAAAYAGEVKPPYRLNAGQIKALWHMEQALPFEESDSSDHDEDAGDEESELSDKTEEQVERHVLAFLIALLDDPLQDHYYKSPLVSATAVLGVDRHAGWKSPMHYTTLLSGIVTVSKMLVLYSAVQERKQAILDSMRTHQWPQEDAEKMAVSHMELVQQSVATFMVLTDYQGRPTPMDWVLRLRAYGKGIQRGTNAAGQVQWVGDTLLYGYVQYSMPQLRSMIHGLVETTRMELRRHLLLLDMDEHGQPVAGTTPLPGIDWDMVVDNPAELRAGWNFLQDPRNTFGGVDGASWLSRRMTNEKQLRRAFVDVEASRTSIQEGRGVAWVARRVQQYGRAMRLFREHLLVAMHMTGGQPARGTELVTTTYVNQPNGQSRGLFVEAGLMVYVTLYHKGIAQTAKAKVIHRYLPREVGELLFYYLWMVLPFWQRLERASGPVDSAPSAPSPFLWEPMREQAWTGPQRRKRHQLQRPQEGSDNGGDSEEQGEAPAAAGRTERWGTNQVRRAMERASLHGLQTKLNIQTWRHNTVAICKRYFTDKDVLKTLASGEDEVGDKVDSVLALQSTHTLATVNQIYGRLADESPFSVQSERHAFRQVSVAWHQFLGFTPTPKEGQAPEASEAHDRAAMQEQYRRRRAMGQTNIQASLERLEGKGAEFRGCQRPVLEAVMQQKSPIVVVMGTGMGKSMIFMLPALTSTGVTVVVVPILSLKHNLLDRCAKAGISCVAWDSQQPCEWAQIVVVVPEAAVSPPFEAFLSRQRAAGRLERVVVDECHIVLESTKGWRTKVLQLRNLVQAETQLVYLTATLKPKEEMEFIRLMALPPKQQCAWFRCATSRPSIAYGVHWFDQAREEEVDVLVRLVEEAKAQYPLPGQILVYCDSVETTKFYAALLGAVCYHRESGTAEEKRDMLRQLTEGRQQVFVGTSALGLGVDRRSIRAVFFIGLVRRLRDLVQQAGRAGRDGVASKAVLIRGARYVRSARCTGAPSTGVEAAVHEILEGRGCIRVVLDREMDGDTSRIRCRGGEETCSWCQEHSDMEEDEAEERERRAFEDSLATRRQLGQQERKRQAQEQLQVRRLEEMLWEWTDCCQWCHVNEWPNEKLHSLAACTRESAADVRAGVGEFQRLIRWERFSCCFTCGVPQSLCGSYVEQADASWKKTLRACYFPGVLAASLLSIWVVARDLFEEWAQKEMEKEGICQVGEEITFEKILAWLAQTIWWGGIQSNKACWVLERFTTRHIDI